MRRIITLFFLAMSPIAYAAEVAPGFDENDVLAPLAVLVVSAGRTFKLLIPLVFSFALLFFFWGITKFIANTGSPEGREKGRSLMLTGIIVFTLMTSLWAIVGFVQDALGIDPASLVAVPVIQAPSEETP